VRACFVRDFAVRKGYKSAAVSREYVSGDAVADDRADTRRKNSRVVWRAEPAKCFLRWRGERGRLEDGRCWADMDADF